MPEDRNADEVLSKYRATEHLQLQKQTIAHDDGLNQCVTNISC